MVNFGDSRFTAGTSGSPKKFVSQSRAHRTKTGLCRTRGEPRLTLAPHAMVQILYVPAGSARASVIAHPCTPTAFSLCRLSVSLLSADLPLSTVTEAVACSLTAQAKLGPDCRNCAFCVFACCCCCDSRQSACTSCWSRTDVNFHLW